MLRGHLSDVCATRYTSTYWGLNSSVLYGDQLTSYTPGETSGRMYAYRLAANLSTILQESLDEIAGSRGDNRAKLYTDHTTNVTGEDVVSQLRRTALAFTIGNNEKAATIIARLFRYALGNLSPSASTFLRFP